MWWYAATAALLASYGALYWNVPSATEKQRATLVPLVAHVSYTPCFPVYSAQMHTQRYFGRPIIDYVRSARYHLRAKRLPGITLYHVGVPLCVIVCADHRRGVLHTLYNPRIVASIVVSGERPATVRIAESDVLCRDAPPHVAVRRTSVAIEYDHVEDAALLANDGTAPAAAAAMKRATLDGDDALTVQHLMDTLRGENMCGRR